MKFPKKRNSILLTFGILLVISSIMFMNFNTNQVEDETKSDVIDIINLESPKFSGSWNFNSIYIDDDGGSVGTNGTWTDVAGLTWCNLVGDTYIIENITVNAGGIGSGIYIRDSTKKFIIRNCTISNNGADSDDAGIRLSDVKNGTIHNNTCSNSNSNGIRLYMSCYNNITNNTLNDNGFDGIELYTGSNNNTITGNTINNNDDFGITLYETYNNTLSNNKMKNCGLHLWAFAVDRASSHDIDTTNQVNSKPLYYFSNREDLNPNHFPNAGQVILANCNDSKIEDVNVSDTSTGIELHFCNNVTIYNISSFYNTHSGINLYYSHHNNLTDNKLNYNDYGGMYLMYSNENNITLNTMNNNDFVGLYLFQSNYNNITYNTLYGNPLCIPEDGCIGNTIENNDCTVIIPGGGGGGGFPPGGGSSSGDDDDDDGEGTIPGYDPFFFFGAFFLSIVFITLTLIKKRLNSQI